MRWYGVVWGGLERRKGRGREGGREAEGRGWGLALGWVRVWGGRWWGANARGAHRMSRRISGLHVIVRRRERPLSISQQPENVLLVRAVTRELPEERPVSRPAAENTVIHNACKVPDYDHLVVEMNAPLRITPEMASSRIRHGSSTARGRPRAPDASLFWVALLFRQKVSFLFLPLHFFG